MLKTFLISLQKFSVEKQANFPNISFQSVCALNVCGIKNKSIMAFPSAMSECDFTYLHVVS
jgi:hypothetical protein